jgi:lysyl-tRNA synthetase class 1
MADQPTSNYWLDVAAAEIIATYPEGQIIVSSGISPSASYHIGHFREILTADALTWAIKQAGREAKHVHVVDNFDPLRKRYDFLPESYEEFVGQPISLVPDPFDDCREQHRTYAEHFYQEFENYAKQMGIVPDQVIRSYEDLYKTGRMKDRISQVLENIDRVREIFESVSGRKMESDWTPVQVIKEGDKAFVNANVSTWDKAAETIEGVSYGDGQAKLNWRLDWPARWAVLGVMVEPFSAQEHGAAGGSYDTGKLFATDIFGSTPPIPGVKYANIHLVGDTKKMSSSKGNLITPKQALEIMPAEILRYFVVRSKPERTLFFDSGQGLYSLIDEFSQIQEALSGGKEHEFADAYRFATAGSGEKLISSVPFNHLVSAYQTARGDLDQIVSILERTGWNPKSADDIGLLKREVPFVKSWLEKYAPVCQILS